MKRLAPIAAALALAPFGASAAPTTYADLASFLAALGGATTATQDFEGYPDGTDLFGVEFLPGVSATTNDEVLEAFTGSGDTELFAFGGQRSIGGLFYEIAVDGYNSIAFDIDAFDPAVEEPGVMEVFFADATSLVLDIFATNPTESDPIFFGIISPIDIVKVIWSEAPEVDGTSNEETALDNFVVANAAFPEVPLPAAAWLFMAGIAGLGFSSRRKAQL